MAVSSKWYVTNIEGQQVTLSPVCRGVENREWASATPGGSMSMWISNPAALAQFTVGEEYHAQFEHVRKPVPGDGHRVSQIEVTGHGKTYYVCNTCGSYATLNEDGTPNWERHEELFAAKD